MAKSIMQDQKECYITHSTLELQEHHVMNGPFRKKSEKYGLKVYLRYDVHKDTNYSVHQNADMADLLKMIAQITFEKIYGHEKWMSEFKKNFLNGDECTGELRARLRDRYEELWQSKKS
ncbi:hypothetical protein MKA35_20505 [[Clostridium] innocuum]|nr:hypothetical protein [[Clostridium] innocuum]MCR0269751.1 hypothetical protein [[Clostridium] innocuum]MCR0487176.1 hypothetical protein [[Clostridium] innocuum]